MRKQEAPANPPGPRADRESPIQNYFYYIVVATQVKGMASR